MAVLEEKPGPGGRRSASVGKAAHSKRTRTVMNPAQNDVLMKYFCTNPFPSTEARKELAEGLSVSPRTVQIWFQNQRQKAKSKAEGTGYPDMYPMYTNFSIPNKEVPRNSLRVLADVAYDEYCRTRDERSMMGGRPKHTL